MTKPDHPVREEDLHAYIDGALDEARREQIERYLEKHPELAERMSSHAAIGQRLREALAPISDEPIPSQLNLARMVESHQSRTRVPWRIAASIVLALGIGGTAGWTMRGESAAANGGISALAREAAASYQVYASDTTRPVEIPAQDSAQLVAWVSQRLRHPIALPNLDQAGYRFMGGRLVATEHGPAGLFLYNDRDGNRIAMLVRPMEFERTMPMSPHARDGVAGYAWSNQGLGYSLMGSASLPDIHPVADEVRRQLSEKTG